MKSNTAFSRGTIAATLLFLPLTLCADGVVIDRIYHPYVQPLERELEWRAVHQDNQPGRPDRQQLHRLAYGQSLNDRWFAEVYLVGEKSARDSFDIEGYELEALWQLTEQGQYWADWGLIMELEKSAHDDIWEASAGLIAEKELGRWSLTGNFFLSQESGGDIDDELESSLGLQARFRYSRLLEPALEFYSGEDTRALGPVLLGSINLAPRRTLRWEAGVIFGLDADSPNRTLRLLLEYEF
jgi:hypothetical protein